MLELFIFLFGGIYYGTKIASDRAGSKARDKKVAAWRAALVAWRAKVVDYSIESEIEELVKNKWDKEEFQRQIKSLCPVLPRDQDRPDNYVRILLASKGKIGADDAIGGIRTPVYYVEGSTYTENAQKRISFNAYMRWLDRELRNNGVCERMVFVPERIIGADNKDYVELDEVDTLKSLQGIFKWVPQVLHMAL